MKYFSLSHLLVLNDSFGKNIDMIFVENEVDIDFNIRNRTLVEKIYDFVKNSCEHLIDHDFETYEFDLASTFL